MHITRHSIWDETGFLIHAADKEGVYLFADLNPEVVIEGGDLLVSRNRALTRGERLRIGLWFIRESFAGLCARSDTG